MTKQKLIIALIATAFSASVFAQATPAPGHAGNARRQTGRHEAGRACQEEGGDQEEGAGQEEGGGEESLLIRSIQESLAARLRARPASPAGLFSCLSQG